MTIGKQVGISLGGTLALCAVIGAVGWWSVEALAARLDESVAVTTRNIELAGELRSSVLMFRLQERGLLLFSFSKAEAQVASSLAGFDKAIGASLEKIATIRALVRTERGRALMDRAEAGVRDYKTQQLKVREFLAAGQMDQAAEWDRKALVTGGAEIIGALDQFDQLMHALNAEANEEALRMKLLTRTVLALGLLTSALLGFGVAWVMRRATTTLRATAVDLQHAAHEVAGAASHVSSSSQSLAQGCSEQAASLEETSASSGEIGTMTRHSADKSRAAAGLVDQSQRRFLEANEALEQTVTAMHDISAQSGRISNIIKVIDGIAFQTNILALNAAVEAARAGEAGMSFAVVADEVRDLAQRCAQAARDTSALIEESIAKSNDGKAKVDQVAVAIHAIIAESAQVKTLVDEVSLGGQEQARGTEQISKAITQMEQVTQQTAASAEESAAAAEQLNAQSDTLNRIVERLNVLVGSEAAA